jgi:hypothetical protein
MEDNIDMDIEEMLREGIECFFRPKTGKSGSFCEECVELQNSIKCGNFLTGTKDPLPSRGGLCSIELDI